ncbi:hypothetical protein [Candidatus Bandiella euplotis]|uniref:Lipoprotein n=1 Tax=Candidatus Bandiella euplotis TaxID=1664265 RepID=A0ABZ0UQG3_9RICK|nr:hypothetical protein [Candidatus Bandiella woodruffii]WPX97155.1 hypothetical protein Bandiella_01299 [Candidatus Bandiella woodruffii]
MNKLLFTTALCLTLVLNFNVSACDKHKNTAQNGATATSSDQTADCDNKKFDYTKIVKDLSEEVKKEVDAYYEKTGKAYDELSDDAKKAVKKISAYKNKVFSKKAKPSAKTIDEGKQTANS